MVRLSLFYRGKTTKLKTFIPPEKGFLWEKQNTAEEKNNVPPVKGGVCVAGLPLNLFQEGALKL